MKKWTKLAITPDQAGIILEKQTRMLRKKNKLIVNVQTIIDLNIKSSLFLILIQIK
jgi:hypothetical protein